MLLADGHVLKVFVLSKPRIKISSNYFSTFSSKNEKQTTTHTSAQPMIELFKANSAPTNKKASSSSKSLDGS